MSAPCELCERPLTGQYREDRHCCRVRHLLAELPGPRRAGLIEHYRRVYGEAAGAAAEAALRVALQAGRAAA